MCRSKVDIQSATDEIRRGKKERKKKETTGQNIMPASATQGGHKIAIWPSKPEVLISLSLELTFTFV